MNIDTLLLLYHPVMLHYNNHTMSLILVLTSPGYTPWQISSTSLTQWHSLLPDLTWTTQVGYHTRYYCNCTMLTWLWYKSLWWWTLTSHDPSSRELSVFLIQRFTARGLINFSVNSFLSCSPCYTSVLITWFSHDLDKTFVTETSRMDFAGKVIIMFPLMVTIF